MSDTHPCKPGCETNGAAGKSGGTINIAWRPDGPDIAVLPGF